jgi:hypothetical protein
MTAASKAQIEHDIAALLAAWESACPEARRAFAEACWSPLDGWPPAEEIGEAEARVLGDQVGSP